MVLLEVLRRLAHANRWKLTVAHFNHQLRGRASEADEKFMARITEEWDLPMVVGRAPVRTFAARHGLSLEMAARGLRHEFLARSACNRGVETIALAHHADDQVELFFLRLLRGAGGEGLAGMKWSSPSPSDPAITLIRPLLGCAKAELRLFAEQQSLTFREDASNASLDFLRNRIRHELLPLLVKQYQPATFFQPRRNSSLKPPRRGSGKNAAPPSIACPPQSSAGACNWACSNLAWTLTSSWSSASARRPISRWP